MSNKDKKKSPRVIKEEAKRTLHEARRVVKAYGEAMDGALLAQLEKGRDELAEARAAKDLQAMKKKTQGLLTLFDGPLSYTKKSHIRLIVEFVLSLAIPLFIIRAFIFGSFEIPSGSMIPTLKVGDRLFVSMYSYGIRIPFTDYKIWPQMPERGDVVVFNPPGEEHHKDFIKRTIAIGGDVVAMRHNQLYINGEAISRQEIDQPCRYLETDLREEVPRGWVLCRLFLEKHGGKKYHVYQTADVTEDFPSLQSGCSAGLEAVLQDGKPACRVPEGHVFFMGDNRDNSSDGRVFGVVPIEWIKGKAQILFWSRGEPDGIRWERMFQIIHGDPK